MLSHWDVAFFECLLRVLERVTKDRNNKPRHALLSPIYFCLITPVFYAGLWIARVTMNTAVERGYFFPSLDTGLDGGLTGATADAQTETNTTNTILHSIFNTDLFEMWTIVDFSTVS